MHDRVRHFIEGMIEVELEQYAAKSVARTKRIVKALAHENRGDDGTSRIAGMSATLGWKAGRRARLAELRRPLRLGDRVVGGTGTTTFTNRLRQIAPSLHVSAVPFAGRSVSSCRIGHGRRGVNDFDVNGIFWWAL